MCVLVVFMVESVARAGVLLMVAGLVGKEDGAQFMIEILYKNPFLPLFPLLPVK